MRWSMKSGDGQEMASGEANVRHKGQRTGKLGGAAAGKDSEGAAAVAGAAAAGEERRLSDAPPIPPPRQSPPRGGENAYKRWTRLGLGLSPAEFDAFVEKVAQAMEPLNGANGGGGGGGGITAVSMLVFANVRLQIAAAATVAVLLLTLLNA